MGCLLKNNIMQRLFYEAKKYPEIDVVFHFAWKGLCGPSAKDVNTQIDNISATFELLKQAKTLNAKKIVFASSMNTLEVRTFLNNPSSVKPRGVYVHVAAKLASEIIARTFCYDNDIQFNEALIAMAYGENNKSKMIPNVFLYSILSGIEPKLVEGNNQYDIIYIDDIVNAMISIGEKGIPGKSYYVGHNWSKTFKEIFTEVKDTINPDATIHFGMYRDDNSIDFNLIDREELTKDTGWIPEANLQESIKRTARWIIDSGINFCA